jgi:hypothetical protein
LLLVSAILSAIGWLVTLVLVPKFSPSTPVVVARDRSGKPYVVSANREGDDGTHGAAVPLMISTGHVDNGFTKNSEGGAARRHVADANNDTELTETGHSVPSAGTGSTVGGFTAVAVPPPTSTTLRDDPSTPTMQQPVTPASRRALAAAADDAAHFGVPDATGRRKDADARKDDADPTVIAAATSAAVRAEVAQDLQLDKLKERRVGRRQMRGEADGFGFAADYAASPVGLASGAADGAVPGTSVGTTSFAAAPPLPGGGGSFAVGTGGGGVEIGLSRARHDSVFGADGATTTRVRFAAGSAGTSAVDFNGPPSAAASAAVLMANASYGSLPSDAVGVSRRALAAAAAAEGQPSGRPARRVQIDSIYKDPDAF